MSTSVCLLDEPFNTVVDLDSLKRLDVLYAFYHKYWWCRRQMFGYYKLCNAILNGLALLTVAVSIVFGALRITRDGVARLPAVRVELTRANPRNKYEISAQR